MQILKVSFGPLIPKLYILIPIRILFPKCAVIHQRRSFQNIYAKPKNRDEKLTPICYLIDCISLSKFVVTPKMDLKVLAEVNFGIFWHQLLQLTTNLKKSNLV